MNAHVTGGTGHLGSILVDVLIEGDHEVKALVQSLENAETVLGGLDTGLVVGNILDVETGITRQAWPRVSEPAGAPL